MNPELWGKHQAEGQANQANQILETSVEIPESDLDSEIVEFFNNPDETPEQILVTLKDLKHNPDNLNYLINELNLIGEPFNAFQFVEEDDGSAVSELISNIVTSDDPAKRHELGLSLKTFLA